jgi:hypothetical protein
MITSGSAVVGVMKLRLLSAVSVILFWLNIADWIPWPDPGRPGNF